MESVKNSSQGCWAKLRNFFIFRNKRNCRLLLKNGINRVKIHIEGISHPLSMVRKDLIFKILNSNKFPKNTKAAIITKQIFSQPDYLKIGNQQLKNITLNFIALLSSWLIHYLLPQKNNKNGMNSYKAVYRDHII